MTKTFTDRALRTDRNEFLSHIESTAVEAWEKHENEITTPSEMWFI